ncbi:MAG TPA: hypothetical protein VNW71_02690 [Thermoanaerobaculia bacterium]|nr:hypothetical protein [Thermoanaerobaculia bacterium]
MLAALLLVGCGDVKSPTEPSAAPEGPAFTFAQIQSQIFTPTCAKAGCHAASAASGEMILEAGQAYGQIVNRPAVGNSSLDRIEPGDPERSYLIKKLRGDPDITGERMPLDNPGSLTQEQMDGIVGWILAGAPNN